MNWMKKEDTVRYENGIRAYLKDKGEIEQVAEFQWGFKTLIIDPKLADDHVIYTFEFQGEDQFSVTRTIMDWNDKDDLEEQEEGKGFITIK